jgi:hypothetical protein
VGTAGLYPGRRSELRATSVVATRRLVLLDRSVVCGEAYLPAALPASTRAATGLCRRAAAQGILLADVACPLGIGSRAAGRIARALECDVENLEAFAVARAAEVAGVPFTGLLGISNRVGSGAHAGWRRNARRAGAAACRAALGMLGG